MSDGGPSIPPDHARVYRVVCESEFLEILATGEFREAPNTLEGKWFADTVEGVLAHAKAYYPDGDYRLIEADVPDFAPSLIKRPNLDGRGPARYLHVDDLAGVTPRPYKP